MGYFMKTQARSFVLDTRPLPESGWNMVNDIGIVRKASTDLFIPKPIQSNVGFSNRLLRIQAAPI